MQKSARKGSANENVEPLSQAVLDEFDELFVRLRSLLVSEYQRGGRDTAKRILGLVGANDQAYEAAGSEIQLNRVPRGSAKVFVENCLQRGPATISELRRMAKTPVERMISYQTIRLELLRGVRDKRYKKNKDHFSLA